MPRTLPKFVERSRSRHGVTTYYFRRDKGPRIRLPSPTDKMFREAYLLAANQNEAMPRPVKEPAPLVRERVLKGYIERSLRRSFTAAKIRAAQKGREFTLEYGWLLARVEASGFRCELTSIRFDTPTNADSQHNPYRPSIDRIDCAKGYTPDNVRVVVFALNVMLSDWGTEVFSRVAENFRRNRWRNPIDRQKSGCGEPEKYSQQSQGVEV